MRHPPKRHPPPKPQESVPPAVIAPKRIDTVRRARRAVPSGGVEARRVVVSRRLFALPSPPDGRKLGDPHTEIRTVESTTITGLLLQLRQGDAAAYDALLPLVYDELRRMAARTMRDERAGHTLQPTALVHEAYLRLVDQRVANFDDRRHFFAAAARTMRRVLVDSARRHRADKRGGGVLVQWRDDLDMPNTSTLDDSGNDVLHVDEALEQLAALDARQAQVVELRYFAGLSVEETAEVMGVSPRTVKRDWAIARAFLHRALSDADRE